MVSAQLALEALKGNASKYARYIAMLPRNVTTIAWYWDAAAIRCLRKPALRW